MKKFMLAVLMVMLSVGFLNAVSISGNCSNVEGESMSNVLILIMDASPMGVVRYFGNTGEDGNYSIDVEYGNYIVAATDSMFTMYYDNVVEPAEATIIEVSAENPNITGIDFVLENISYEGDGIISGNISNENGEPIVDAYIDLMSINGQFYYTGITDGNGNFLVEGIPQGDYYLSVWAFGYPAYYYENATSPEDSTILVIEEGTIIEGLEIILGENETETIVVTGIVLDAETGEPIENAEVWAMRNWGNWGRDENSPREEFGSTDENGEYSLDIIAGDYYFEAYAEDYHPQWFDHQDNWEDAELVSIVADSISIDFDLNIIPVNENSFYGTVTTEEGEPVPNALIFLLQENDGYWMGAIDSLGITDQNGEYLIENISQGEHIVSCSQYWGMLPIFYENTYNIEDAVVFNVLEDSNFEANFTLIEPEIYSISGTVLDETGNPVADAEIWAMGGFDGNPRDWNTEPFGITDENGEFTLSVIEGEYWIECWANDYMPQWFDHKNDFSEADVIVVTGDLENVNFDLIPYETYENTISGTILIDGEIPEEEVFVCAYSEDFWYSGMAITDENGNYTIENLPPFEYYVQAYSFFTIPMFFDNVYDFEEATTVVAEGSITGIDFNLSTLERDGLITLNGIISDSNGDPVINSTVLITDTTENIESYAMTNNDGYFEALGISGGSYTVKATKVFYETATEEMLINQNGTVNMNIDPIPTSSTEENGIIPTNNIALKNYPNPFNPVTTISFNTFEASKVELSVFNIKGKKVVTLINDELESGSHSYNWNGTDANGKTVASGIYFYKMKSGRYSTTKKMILMK
ncbi:MAG: carboxypeptidase regulatory-like domain-containing protein [Candidatus Cloacimonetes bacterium]|nr:carboxypeptidase regulatory-like domain-containing protein [Candidatus Cloacimonadota bacterium]